MARGTLFGSLGLAAAVVAGLVAARLVDRSPEPELSAPPLHFTDINKDPKPLIGENVKGDGLPKRSFAKLEGGMARLQDYEGKPLVINFFASTCPPCIEEMPVFEALHQRLGSSVNFVGVSLKESVEDARSIVERTQVTYDIIRDPSGSLANELQVVLMPTTFFVSAEGVVIESSPGALSSSELESKVKGLMR